MLRSILAKLGVDSFFYFSLARREFRLKCIASASFQRFFTIFCSVSFLCHRTPRVSFYIAFTLSKHTLRTLALFHYLSLTRSVSICDSLYTITTKLCELNSVLCSVDFYVVFPFSVVYNVERYNNHIKGRSSIMFLLDKFWSHCKCLNVLLRDSPQDNYLILFTLK